MDVLAAKTAVVEAGHRLVERGLVSRTWGNVSCRIDGARFAITPSGMGYDRVRPEDIVIVDIETLKYEGDVKPSSEKGIHAAVYRLHPEANFVIHTHQAYATVASLDKSAPTGNDAALGRIRIAGYGLPGSKTLKNAVAKELSPDCGAVLMSRHGALLFGRDSDEAFCRAEALETLCESAVTGGECGNGALVFDDAPLAREYDDAFKLLALEIKRLHPKLGCVERFNSGSIELAAAECGGTLPAVLDDFAQMAGVDVSVVPLDESDIAMSVKRAAKALGSRNCVIVPKLGAICCALSASDARAIGELAAKNALAYTHAKKRGVMPPLPLLDRVLMRIVYTTKYSKKK